MTDHIGPALLPEEYEMARRPMLARMMGVEAANRGNLPVAIAFLNAALPASDARKITREWIGLLRHVTLLLQLELDEIRREGGHEDAIRPRAERVEQMRHLTDALESYLLPPGESPRE